MSAKLHESRAGHDRREPATTATGLDRDGPGPDGQITAPSTSVVTVSPRKHRWPATRVASSSGSG